jgi:hypothetical protein
MTYHSARPFEVRVVEKKRNKCRQKRTVGEALADKGKYEVLKNLRTEWPRSG